MNSNMLQVGDVVKYCGNNDTSGKCKITPLVVLSAEGAYFQAERLDGQPLDYDEVWADARNSSFITECFKVDTFLTAARKANKDGQV